MRQCTVYCVNTQQDSIADVLDESTKHMKVVLANTSITLTMSRSDTRRPYVGTMYGMEFETFGELE